jgi:AAA15 family ATPase/GTPase
MIVNFSVQNFRSIKERIEISFVKTGLKGLPNNYFEGPSKTSLLKTAVLYGPNASGKSTVLRAFNALEFMVLKSSGFKPDQSIPPYEPHLLDSAYKNQPLEFRIMFFGKDQFKYEFILSTAPFHNFADEGHVQGFGPLPPNLLYVNQTHDAKSFGM